MHEPPHAARLLRELQRLAASLRARGCSDATFSHTFLICTDTMLASLPSEQRSWLDARVKATLSLHGVDATPVSPDHRT